MVSMEANLLMTSDKSNNIYIGNTYSLSNGSSYKYEISTNNWTKLPNLTDHTNYATCGCEYYNNKIYFFGGYNGYIGVEYLTVKPIIGNTFTKSKYNNISNINLQQKLWYTQTVHIGNGIIYLICGYTGSSRSSSIYVYNADYDYMYLSNIVFPSARNSHGT